MTKFEVGQMYRDPDSGFTYLIKEENWRLGKYLVRLMDANSFTDAKFSHWDFDDDSRSKYRIVTDEELELTIRYKEKAILHYVKCVHHNEDVRDRFASELERRKNAQ